MDNSESFNELLRALWSLGLAGTALLILVVYQKLLVKLGAFFLTIGYILNSMSLVLFSSYTEEEFIRWMIRLGITMVLFGILYGEDFTIPKFLQRKRKPKPSKMEKLIKSRSEVTND